MGDSSDDVVVSHSQQAQNADADLSEARNSDPGIDSAAAQEREKSDLKQALERQDLDHIDEVFENNPSLVNSLCVGQFKDTPLQFAIRWGLKRVASHLLQRPDIKESINQVDCEGLLPLHRALYNGHWKGGVIFETLIERTSPSNLSIRTDKEETVLHLASRSQQLDVVKRLCSKLPREAIDLKNRYGCAAIHEGIGNWEVVEYLRGYVTSRVTNDRDDTLLHAAVSKTVLDPSQGFSTGRALLAEGVHLGTQNKDNDTPMHLAVSNLNRVYDGSSKEFTVLEELLGLSAEAPHNWRTESSLPDALGKHNNSGATVLHIIASTKLHDVSPDSSTLQYRQLRQVVERIVSIHPASMLSEDEEGNTPLHRACFSNNWVVVEMLCEAAQALGSEAYHITKIQNKAGDMPMHVAVLRCHLEAVKKLIACDRSVESVVTRNRSRETLLHAAPGQGQLGGLRKSLKESESKRLEHFDDEYNLRDKRGMTPLHIAAGGGMHEIAIQVFEQILYGCTGPKLLNEVEPTNGWTSLHFAAKKSHERIVELLLVNGADSKQTDKHNLLAADIARRANRIYIADFIRQYRLRRFRLTLERDENNAKIDDHFLALSWPTWDKAARQQLGEPPRARMWPQVASVNQLIYEANDVVYKAVINDEKSWKKSELPLDRSILENDKFEAVHLAPIHQSQIRLVTCEHKGWIMRENEGFQILFPLTKKENQPEQIMEAVSPVSLFDSRVFEDSNRSTRWIHFPANNIAWVEDLCRCMYSHGSLHSEGIEILRFIEDSFEEVKGFQNYRYRKHGFISHALEKITDPSTDSGQHDVSNPLKAKSCQESAATSSSHANQSGDNWMGREEYSAYSVVFPLLDMDFMKPGFCNPLESDIKQSKNKTQASHDHQTSPAVANSQRTDRMSSLKRESAPSMDVTRENVLQTHWKNMKALGRMKTVHSSRSLDHYCHQHVSNKELQKRNEDQVLTRFMERSRSGGDPFLTHEEVDYLKKSLSMCSNLLAKLRRSISRSHDSGQPEARMEEGQGGGKTTADAVRNTNALKNAPTPNTRGTQSPAHILVVPQLWLWKFDNLVITSFPERWDCTYQHDSLLDAIRERVEYLNIDHEIHPNRLITEILTACAEFQPTLSVGEQSFTWKDAFDDEILLVSRDIKNCYAVFQRNLGMSDASFSTDFLGPTKCLRSIDDVLDELTSIRRVFQDQLQVWEKVHTGDASCVVCWKWGKGQEDEKKKDACPSNVVAKRSLELITRLEEDALKVRESASIYLSGEKTWSTKSRANSLGQVVTLLTLLQGEASTENSLKASQQSKILAVFTVVTVIFAPLSWVTSLFAVEVKSFPPTWTMKDLGLGSVYTLIVTLAICALTWPLWNLLDRNLFRRKVMGDKKKAM